MRFRLQNLNEKQDGSCGSIVRNGRCWLYFGEPYVSPRLGLEWSVPTHFLHVGIEFDGDEDDVQFRFACGLFAIWLSIGILRWNWLPKNRECKIAFHNQTLWINPWSHPDEWNSADPWWRRGVSLNFEDLLAGKPTYEMRELSTHEVLIPMPEGSYPATVKIQEHTSKRPRWFAKTRRSCWVDMQTGIPHEGKGTASWNCGEDGIWGCGTDGESVEKAVGHAVACALEYRKKYGAPDDLKPVMSHRVKSGYVDEIDTLS